MKRFIDSYRYYLLLVLIYFFSELLVNPTGNFPLNDDWSYAKTVLTFLEKGKMDIGDWPAMTLATHILWGSMFVKLFGFSFFVLRISTWISVLIGTFTLFTLVNEITGKQKTAFLLSITLLFNPIYYNVSNTFMTDVNFLTLLIICCYLSYQFFAKNNKLAFFLLLPMSVLLVLLRQYGIIVPVSLVVACLFMNEKKWLYFTLSLIMTVLVYACLGWYEAYLKSILTTYAAYKFSGNVDPSNKDFWELFWYHIVTRYKIILIHIFFHTIIFTIAFVPAIFKMYSKKILLIVFSLNAVIVYYLFYSYPLQVGNVFQDTGVGTDTSYETLIGTYGDAPHFYSRLYEKFLDILKVIYMSIGVSVIVLLLVNRFKKGKPVLRPESLFIIILLLAYLIMILITESFFDRYQIPVILLALIVFAFVSKGISVSGKAAIVPFVIIFYISVFGTRDYFTWNKLKWDAVAELKKRDGVQTKQIHGGFEVICWNDGKPAVWYDFSVLHIFDYLIQYQQEDSFAVYREYPFQRFLPFKKDTIRVFKRNKFAAGKGAVSKTD